MTGLTFLLSTSATFKATIMSEIGTCHSPCASHKRQRLTPWTFIDDQLDFQPHVCIPQSTIFRYSRRLPGQVRLSDSPYTYHNSTFIECLLLMYANLDKAL